MSDIICRAKFTGRVQGVGFRAFVEHEAHRQKLAGWVRNRRDGSVEAVFAGPPAVVEGVIEACRRGPIGARVDAVYRDEATEEDLAGGTPCELFSMRPTV